MSLPFKVVIPARFASTRLPGKPLLSIAGRPMLEHVYRQAIGSGAGEVVIATDDERIRQAAEGFGAQVLMTDSAHPSGTDRLAEVARRMGWSADTLVVNLQGDEPLMPVDLLLQVAENLAAFPDASMATLCAPITGSEEIFDPHAVKVVMDRAGYALYFSRAPIPWDRDSFALSTDALPEGVTHYRHIGLYAYRAGFLHEYQTLAPCELERAESLEQLRALWHGHRIHVDVARVAPPPDVNTAADLERVRRIIEIN